jgi:hypothetical protein
MQGFTPNDRFWAIDDSSFDFFTSVGRKAMHEY